MEFQRESTEYVFTGWTGDIPAVGADLAFLAAGVRPTTGDWQTAIIVPDNSHALWADAVLSGVAGTYYIAIKLGAYNGGTLVLDPGDYQPWAKLSDTDEQPVRIVPQTITVA